MSFKDPQQRKAYHRAYHRKWYLANKERKDQQNRANYQKNREAYLATNSKWEKANWVNVLARKKRYRDSSTVYREYLERSRKRRNERNKAWAKSNRDKMNTVKHRRRSKEQLCQGSHTTAEWKAVLDRYNHTCLRCGKRAPEVKLQRDHVIPVIVGGSNDIENIQPLCGPCNKWKGDKAIDYRPKFLRSAQRRGGRRRTSQDQPTNLELFSPSPPPMPR